ncbi:TPA: hypothetical protein NKQ81_004625 [Vibrio parahaemolyticus]|uniref:hypothetical protein n=1 Tax=Vibrio parahaemolyticus TaxID=670 RepID=UPI001869D66D|nr:hypothetical protein [Vibrio parahaemolyticus]MBE4440807.1 hypothetical protein [Vibrio parahaemolyticus]MCR9881597.1 GNAT family N-acetyltransferase [Vibrio parahaemolyticus]MCR9895083.1 GNAT family N-acetyltransferase [Vibrio parahaemolyticus]MDF5058452.1 hypothetical protein [Vibrio parahaemolyticus]HCH1474579.1 hypothetical protein [Vibrio parahaemolyticus]
MSDYELFTHHKISENESVKICIDEDEFKLIVFNESNEKVGEIEFSELNNGFKIRWMYLDFLGDDYKHKGIGRAALVYFKEIYQMPIYANNNDGLVYDDGSHLTGDAPFFIDKMRSEKIVS